MVDEPFAGVAEIDGERSRAGGGEGGGHWGSVWGEAIRTPIFSPRTAFGE
jgi:hypothetical protein